MLVFCCAAEILQTNSDLKFFVFVAKVFLNKAVSTSDLALKQIDTAVTSTLTALPYAESIDILIVNFSRDFGFASNFRPVWEVRFRNRVSNPPDH
jgi:hypothetical protein